jgi:hypothetical protein
MRRNILFIAIFLFVIHSVAVAQFYPTQYRPPVDWQQLSTPHFNIIYPLGEDSVAWKTARILEKEYPGVQSLTGGELSDFPVILTNYNDRSNGLVSSLHFRSEIDIPPIKGKALNPATGGWLENVAPHELVHALQLSHLGGFGLGRLVNIFSPDLARSMHGATPSGIREGLATYYESEHVAPGGGRGNYPFFFNQFNSIFNSPDRWSLGQMVHVPAQSRPALRHYMGGYEFTKWLQDTYGPETSRNAIDFNIRCPFLGYGVALKQATGKWPSQLYDDFEEAKEKQLNAQAKASARRLSPLPISYEGSDIRRPKWLNDSTLVFYGAFYDAGPGFYRYNLNTNELKRRVKTRSVTDYNYVLTNNNLLIYSYYNADLRYPNTFKSTLVKALLSDGSSKTLQEGSRLYSPSLGPDSTLLALQTHHTNARLVQFSSRGDGSLEVLFSSENARLISVNVHPQNPDSLTVVMNRNGTQGLWLASKKNLKEQLSAAPNISFTEGSVFDPVWNPGGGRLLFSADFSGTMQLYEYRALTGEITQITNTRYNALEGSYNKDGSKIAFVIQQKHERLPVVLDRANFHETLISAADTSASKAASFSLNENSWEQQSYAPGLSWLKPRAVIPAFDEVLGSDLYRFGAGIHSSNQLQEQAYSLEATIFENRLWYDASYQNKSFFPGFKARIFSEPAVQNFRFVDENDNSFARRFIRQQRSFALSVPTTFTLEQNVRFTSFFVEPEIRQSQFRYFNTEGDKASDFSNATIGNLFGQFNYKLQQNLRDVQPHSGGFLYGEVEHFFKSGSLDLTTSAGTANLDFSNPTALRGGLFGYISPLRRWNQSLRLGVEAITQTRPVFNNQTIISDGFSESPFPFSNNLISLNSRYTIPLVYPENGGLLLPLYLSSIYISAFTNTVADPAAGSFLDSSRSVFGGGLRFRFRISNLALDIGVGIGVEPSRGNVHYFIGDF